MAPASGGPVTERALVVFGCGGHGRVVADASRAAGRAARGFLDDAPDLPETIDGYPLLGGGERLDEPRFVDAHDFVVAIGDCRTRRSLCERILARGGRLATVVHPNAVIAPDVEIGRRHGGDGGNGDPYPVHASGDSR